MTTLTIANGLIGVGLVSMGLPLARRKVPRNPAYGVRTRASMASDASWYEINELYGWRFVKLGAPMILLGAIGWLVSPAHLLAYTVASCVAPIVALLVPMERWLIKTQAPPVAPSEGTKAETQPARHIPRIFLVLGLLAFVALPNIIFWPDIVKFGTTLLLLFLLSQIVPLVAVLYFLGRRSN